ncbi:MAG: endonuclease domain-containing protein [Actinomycetota bacterium]
MAEHHTVVALWETQYGVVSRIQLRALGLTYDQIATKVRQGLLAERHRGVFLVGRRQDDFKQEAMAAVIAGGDGAVLARRAAGALRGIPNITRWPEVLVDSRRHIKVPGLTVIRTRNLAAEDVTTVFGIPATTGERTLVDLADVYSPAKLRPMVDNFLIHRVANRTKLATRAGALAHPGRAGPRRVLALLDEWPEVKREIGSEFELGLYRILMGAGLELPIPQYEVQTPFGVKFIDFAYPRVKLALEADSYLWHASRLAFERDRARAQELIALGWRPLPITWGDVRYRPERIVDLVGRALAA